jgi:hypothetical protein
MSNAGSQSILYNMTPSPEITIRPAYADDQLAVQRLASLDSATVVPPHPLLVAEVDGELRVALSVHDDSAIADPFFPTAEIIGLLRTHARANKPRRRMPKLGAIRTFAPGTRTARRKPAWSR